jgi:hypothetical protein
VFCPFSFKIVLIVRACSSSHHFQIERTIPPSLLVESFFVSCSESPKQRIGSVLVSATPQTLVSVPFLEVAFSPTISRCFLFIRMTFSPPTAGSSEFVSILASPALLRRLDPLFHAQDIT